MNSQPLDVIPLWCFCLLTILICMLVVEGGYRFGAWRHARESGEKEGSVAGMVAALFGLLAFMLAFTFSLAASRFDARRQAVLDEANVIGTTWLRTRLLPKPQRSETARLVRRYTELRVEYIKADRVSELRTQSEELHEELWKQGIAAAEKAPSPITELFLQSLNEMIDMHSKRVYVSLHSRIPIIVWLALFGLTLLGMGSVGYHAGLSATRRSPVMPILTLAFSGVLFLIVDLDRAHEGLLRVSQQPTIDLLNTMQVTQP